MGGVGVPPYLNPVGGRDPTQIPPRSHPFVPHCLHGFVTVGVARRAAPVGRSVGRLHLWGRLDADVLPPTLLQPKWVLHEGLGSAWGLGECLGGPLPTILGICFQTFTQQQCLPFLRIWPELGLSCPPEPSRCARGGGGGGGGKDRERGVVPLLGALTVTDSSLILSFHASVGSTAIPQPTSVGSLPTSVKGWAVPA